MDKKTFVASLAILSETLPPGRPLTDSAVEGYWIGLAGLTDEQISTAVTKALRTSKFMPAPAELRDLAGVGTKAKATIAWEAVLGAIRKYDYTTSVDFGPLVNAVIRHMGGWLALCDKGTSGLTIWAPKEFERIWALLETQDAGSLSGAPLPGAFPGPPVQIAIGGVTPPRQLADARSNGVAEHVRRLAERMERS